MPDDLSKKISDVLNKKSITPEDELQAALDEMARDIALIEPNPGDWEWWVTYLLEKLEEEAQRRGKQAEFVKMLEHLKKDIDN
jgi:hypothetical protein